MKLEVIDVNGRLLQNQTLSTTKNTIDTALLPAGMYFFKITSSQGTSTTKVIKE